MTDLTHTHTFNTERMRKLPQPVADEVNDFIDFLLFRRDVARWELWRHFTEAMEIGESDFSEYLSNLEDYENRLARGEIRW